jgi:hypothetical protein
MSADDQSQKPSARRFAFRPIFWAVVFAIGLAGWLSFASGQDPDRAWRALLINFVYFSGLASGLVVWPAVVILSRGGWMGPLEKTALSGITFAPFSIAGFAALYFGRAHWAAWMYSERPAIAVWLNSASLFTRDGLALLVLWALALWFVLWTGHRGRKVLAAWLAFAFCIVWSLLAFDLIMALDPPWVSTLFGAYFFITCLYIAMAAWTLLVLLLHPAADRGTRQEDFGKLIVAFSLASTYMIFSQLLPIWYENLGHEVRFVLPRLRLAPWRWVSLGLLTTVYLGPLVLLLTRWSKKTSWFLGAVALVVLVGMWVERWWLVTPTLGGSAAIGPVELSITAAFIGVFGFGISLFRFFTPPATQGRDGSVQDVRRSRRERPDGGFPQEERKL